MHTIQTYLQSASTVKAKIEAIESLIVALELNMVDVVANAGILEFEKDTGQTRIQTRYNSVDKVVKGIDALEKIKQRYINDYNGRVVTLVGGRNTI